MIAQRRCSSSRRLWSVSQRSVLCRTVQVRRTPFAKFSITRDPMANTFCPCMHMAMCACTCQRKKFIASLVEAKLLFVLVRLRIILRPVPKGVRGVRKNPPARPQGPLNRTKFIFSFCVLFVAGPCCNHSVFTAKMHKIAGFGSIFAKFSRGSMPPDPPRRARASPQHILVHMKTKRTHPSGLLRTAMILAPRRSETWCQLDELTREKLSNTWHKERWTSEVSFFAIDTRSIRTENSIRFGSGPGRPKFSDGSGAFFDSIYDLESSRRPIPLNQTWSRKHPSLAPKSCVLQSMISLYSIFLGFMHWLKLEPRIGAIHQMLACISSPYTWH